MGLPCYLGVFNLLQVTLFFQMTNLVQFQGTIMQFLTKVIVHCICYSDEKLQTSDVANDQYFSIEMKCTWTKRLSRRSFRFASNVEDDF